MFLSFLCVFVSEALQHNRNVGFVHVLFLLFSLIVKCLEFVLENSLIWEMQQK